MTEVVKKKGTRRATKKTSTHLSIELMEVVQGAKTQEILSAIRTLHHLLLEDVDMLTNDNQRIVSQHFDRLGSMRNMLVQPQAMMAAPKLRPSTTEFPNIEPSLN